MTPTIILALALLGGGPGPQIGQPQPWPTPQARPPTLVPWRDLLIPARPTLGPQSYFPMAIRHAALLRATPTPTPTRTPTATSRPVTRPDTEDELKRALLVPGAYVVPKRALYRPAGPLRMAAQTTLDGHGLLTLEGEGLYMYQATGAVARNLRIQNADGDGIGVAKSGGVLIENVVISGWGDGGIDIVQTPLGSGAHIIRDVVLENGTKGMLLGHQNHANDSLQRVHLVRVTFWHVQVRVPKVHWAQVLMRDCAVVGWGGPRLDIQKGGYVDMIGTRYEAGPKSSMLASGNFTEAGTVYIPWKGGRVPE